ncbi:MAG: phosphoenolpyruvate--protein phosphotransferase [Pseudomonadales bacterium]|nr:phosphoenolpyruvate--protein phosphotransferase [Pseudomonadales bacterium]
MLESLRQIVQEVSSANDIQLALELIVTRVRAEMQTDVCSVYLLDRESGRYVFMATDGLNKSSQGKISLAKDQGLVGQVVQRAEPINLDNAQEHHAFKLLPDIGEEPFNAFLGTPIIYHREILGVLIVQQSARRHFDQVEESFLITISAQLAAVIAHAQATGAIKAHGDRSHIKQDVQFSGISGSIGIAIGRAVVVSPRADFALVAERHIIDVSAEIEFFRSCLNKVRTDIQQLKQKFADRVSKEELLLFDVYLAMLNQQGISQEVEQLIETDKLAATTALRDVVQAHLNQFKLMDDSYLRERAIDVKDLGLRILSYLQDAAPTIQQYEGAVILVGEELSPAMLAEVPRDKLVGLVSVKGSSHSHVAILARSMGVPTLSGVVDLPINMIDGLPFIIDGFEEKVIANASDALTERYQKFAQEEKLSDLGLEQFKSVPSETIDGHALPIFVNTGLTADILLAKEKGADGVGLYRTEVPFLISERFPSEEEQKKIYQEQLQVFHPQPVTMRTLDIGGDKSLPYFPIEEENPALGWRGVRVTLDHPEIFLSQVRAMLRANEEYGNLRIMLPMISRLDEFEEAKQLIIRAFNELNTLEGIPVPMPEIGAMIEVPSILYQLESLAKKADFLSVGSNDLTQYLLAVDRNNTHVSQLYNAYHPAVIRALADIASRLKRIGTPFSICGELAGDPAAAVLLLAMGFDAISVSPNRLLKVKSLIRFVDMPQARRILDAVLKLDHSQDIKDYLQRNLDQVGITPLFKEQSNTQSRLS